MAARTSSSQSSRGLELKIIGETSKGIECVQHIYHNVAPNSL